MASAFSDRLLAVATYALLASCTTSPQVATSPPPAATSGAAPKPERLTRQAAPSETPPTLQETPEVEAPRFPDQVGSLLCEGEPQIACFERWLQKDSRMALRGSPSTASTSNRIVGGTKYKELPAIGAIRGRESRSKAFETHCTGTLIGNFTILTAAHCVFGYEKYDLEFVLDPNALSPKESNRFRVASRLVHPQYMHGIEHRGMHDIALLFLDPNKAPDIAIARLPIAATSKVDALMNAGTALFFVGYGFSKKGKDDTGEGLGYKRIVQMPVKHFDKTRFRYDADGSGKNTCNGDSGGPALSFDDSTADAPKVPVIVGITSWGDKPCTEYGVDVRTDAYYYDWIKKYIDQPPTPTTSNTPKADTPKADTPKADTPKADTPKADTPKADTPKVQ